jgi:hypothetical protein
MILIPFDAPSSKTTMATSEGREAERQLIPSLRHLAREHILIVPSLQHPAREHTHSTVAASSSMAASRHELQSGPRRSAPCAGCMPPCVLAHTRIPAPAVWAVRSPRSRRRPVARCCMHRVPVPVGSPLHACRCAFSRARMRGRARVCALARACARRAPTGQRARAVSMRAGVRACRRGCAGSAPACRLPQARVFAVRLCASASPPACGAAACPGALRLCEGTYASRRRRRSSVRRRVSPSPKSCARDSLRRSARGGMQSRVCAAHFVNALPTQRSPCPL